jgi:hypothetical protein
MIIPVVPYIFNKKNQILDNFAKNLFNMNKFFNKVKSLIKKNEKDITDCKLVPSSNPNVDPVQQSKEVCIECSSTMTYIRQKKFNCNNPKSEFFCNGTIKPPGTHDGYDFQYWKTKKRYDAFMKRPLLGCCIEYYCFDCSILSNAVN